MSKIGHFWCKTGRGGGGGSVSFVAKIVQAGDKHPYCA